MAARSVEIAYADVGNRQETAPKIIIKKDENDRYRASSVELLAQRILTLP
jgi:hypothetical protein